MTPSTIQVGFVRIDLCPIPIIRWYQSLSMIHWAVCYWATRWYAPDARSWAWEGCIESPTLNEIWPENMFISWIRPNPSFKKKYNLIHVFLQEYILRRWFFNTRRSCMAISAGSEFSLARASCLLYWQLIFLFI